MQHQQSPRKRPRARTIAVAAFLATATAGATIAGLTAANANDFEPPPDENSTQANDFQIPIDEAPTPQTGFTIVRAPGSIHNPDRGVEVIGVGLDEGNAAGLAHLGADRACNESGYDFTANRNFSAPVKTPDGGVQVTVTGTCN